jgi:hypothetical protein
MCEETETMEHLLYDCENYSAKIWDLAGKSMTFAISRHTGDYIPYMVLTPLEIVFNKPHPSLLLHIMDATTRKVLILYLQEIKRVLSIGMHSYKNPEEEKNFTLILKIT